MGDGGGLARSVLSPEALKGHDLRRLINIPDGRPRSRPRRLGTGFLSARQQARPSELPSTSHAPFHDGTSSRSTDIHKGAEPRQPSPWTAASMVSPRCGLEERWENSRTCSKDTGGRPQGGGEQSGTVASVTSIVQKYLSRQPPVAVVRSVNLRAPTPDLLRAPTPESKGLSTERPRTQQERYRAPSPAEGEPSDDQPNARRSVSHPVSNRRATPTQSSGVLSARRQTRGITAPDHAGPGIAASSSSQVEGSSLGYASGSRAGAPTLAWAGIRELSNAEVDRRQQNATEWFSQAHAINEQSQKTRQVDGIISDIRQCRTRPKENIVFKDSPSDERNAGKALAPIGMSIAPNTNSSGPQEINRSQCKSPENSQAPANINESHDDPQPKKRQTMLEKFGYGVKPDTENRNWKNLGHAVNLGCMIKRNAMVEVKVGDGDFLQRLAHKKDSGLPEARHQADQTLMNMLPH